MGYAVGGPLIILSIVCFNPIFSIYSGNGDLMRTAHLPFVVALLITFSPCPVMYT